MNKRLFAFSIAFLSINCAINASTMTMVIAKQERLQDLNRQLGETQTKFAETKRARDEAFETVKGWVGGWAAWGLLAVSIGTNKQPVILQKIEDCKGKVPCTPCIKEVLEVLGTNSEQAKAAEGYMWGIPDLDKTMENLNQKKATLEEQIAQLENN